MPYLDPHRNAVRTTVTFFNEGVAGWVAGGVGAVVNDPVNFIDTQALQLQCANNNIVTATRAVVENISSDHIGMELYFPTQADIDNCDRLLVSMDTNFANWAQIAYAIGTDFNQYFEAGRWGPFNAHKRDWTIAGGAFNWNVITSIYISLKAKAAVATNLTFGQWYRAPSLATGQILLFFDDGYDSIFTMAYPHLNGLGFGATTFIIGITIGAAGVLTLPECQVLQNNGWTVANHTWAAGDLTLLTRAQIVTDLQAMIDWMVANGLNGYHLLALPAGQGDANVFSACRELNISYVRNTQQWYQPAPVGDLLKSRACFVIDSTVNQAAARAYVDQVVADNAQAAFLFHQLVNPGPAVGFQWTQADFNNLMDYINIQVGAGNLLAPESLESYLDTTPPPAGNVSKSSIAISTGI